MKNKKQFNEKEYFESLLLRNSEERLEERFKPNFAETLKHVRNDLLCGDSSSLESLLKIRRCIQRNLLIPQADIDNALSVDLKNWKGANVSGRVFSALRRFDFTDAHTDFLQVNGSIHNSTFDSMNFFEVKSDVMNTKIKRDQNKNKIGGGLILNIIGGDQNYNEVGKDQIKNEIGGSQSFNKIAGDLNENEVGGNQNLNEIAGDLNENIIGGNQSYNKIYGNRANNKVKKESHENSLGGVEENNY